MFRRILFSSLGRCTAYINEKAYQIEASPLQTPDTITNIKIDTITNFKIDTITNVKIDTITNVKIYTITNIKIDTITNIKINTITNIKIIFPINGILK
jgi:hypothetical protein